MKAIKVSANWLLLLAETVESSGRWEWSGSDDADFVLLQMYSIRKSNGKIYKYSVETEDNQVVEVKKYYNRRCVKQYISKNRGAR